MNKDTRRRTTQLAVQAYYYYINGCRLEAEHLILQAATFACPVGSLISETLN